ncbi:MAG: PrsW family intramembrane metalloprotease [Clostridia bacterium]|nr:PrsW family intramembrane metalloprotease [Clostridia bacterium]
MNYASFGISVIALLPALVLCIYIYIKDRVEKEPIGLLAALFGIGAIAFAPALLSERLALNTFDRIFAESMTYSPEGFTSFASVTAKISHQALCSFVGIALIEEAIKWICLFVFTHKSKHFNSLFDGLIYSAFISLGFAAVENVRYSWINGWDTLLLRSVTTVPSHLFFGIFMGVCYTVWHAYHTAAIKEKELIDAGKLSETKFKKSKLWLTASLCLPILVHGIYSFIGSGIFGWLNKVFYIFIIILYIVCFIGINKLSKDDGSNEKTAYKWLLRKHTELDASALHETATEGE